MATQTEAPKTTTVTEVFARVAITEIHPDPDQPRKTFDEQQLAELAASIKEHGVVVPIELRPHPTKNHGSYMLVAGERRWRASKLAGIGDIPAVIKTLTDKQALEHQLLENSQRVNVPPLEEGEAYKALIDEHGYTMAMLVQKTGRSQAHLYDRMKLTKLAPQAKKALVDGHLSSAIAELATRIHDAKLQEQFVREALGHGKYEAYDEAGVSNETLQDHASGEREREPLSFRAAAQLLRRRYMLRLELAKFDTADAKLVTKAGACTTCPKRSGNQPELPGMNGAAAEDLCTDPACFEAKTTAAWAAAAATAKAADQTVLDQKKSKNLFGYRDELRDDAPVAALDQQLPYNLRKPGSNATFGKLLGKEVANIPKILVQDPTGAPRELLDKDAAIKKLRELGKLDEAKKQKATSSGAGAKYLKEQKAEKAKRELNEAALQRVLAQVAEKAAGIWKPTSATEQKVVALVRWALLGIVEECGSCGGQAGQPMLDRRSFEHYGHLEQAIQKAKGGEVIAMLVEYAFSAQSEGKVNGHIQQHRKIFEDGLKLLGVDWNKAVAAAKDASKAEAKVDAAKDAKKAAPAKAKKGKSK